MYFGRSDCKLCHLLPGATRTLLPLSTHLPPQLRLRLIPWRRRGGGGAEERRRGGEEERKGREEEQRSGGEEEEEERRSGGAEERRSGGAEEEMVPEVPGHHEVPEVLVPPFPPWPAQIIESRKEHFPKAGAFNAKLKIFTLFMR